MVRSRYICVHSVVRIIVTADMERRVDVMEKILLKGGEKNVTVISNVFLDNYMIKANGEYVKVYLYLLRCLSDNDKELTIGYLADVLEHTENDIIRAIKYWAGQGLLTVEYNGKEITSISMNSFEETKSEAEEEQTATVMEEDDEEKGSSNEETKVDMSVSKEKLSELMADEDIKMLLYIVQRYMEKTLSSGEINTILYLYSNLGFSSELIEYLVEYCVSNNHKTMRYIEKVALNWHEQNITTVEEAKKYVASFSNSCYPVLNAFGLSGRNPAAVEKAFIVKWTDEYGFDMDIIVDACNRTIEAIHKPSFQYADSILQRWLKKGVKSVADIRTIDDEHEKLKESKNVKAAKKAAVPKTVFNNFSQRTYDYDAMERMLLQRK